MQSVFGNNSGVNLNSLFTMKDVSEKTQDHLKKVYMCVFSCAIICATGMYLNATFILSGILMNIASIAVSIFFLCQIMNKQNSEGVRMAYLAGFAFKLGFLVGPAINMIADVEPELLI